MPAQPEIEAYLNFVADRLDLCRDIQFGTRVVAMAFDEDAGLWAVRTEAGGTLRVPFVVAASGILSVPLEPDIPAMDTFTGTSLLLRHRSQPDGRQTLRRGGSPHRQRPRHRRGVGTGASLCV
jgi:cation diffusion facilitator CzcD-associated flavoprotein CzcO